LNCPHRIAGGKGKGDEFAMRMGQRSLSVFLRKREKGLGAKAKRSKSSEVAGSQLPSIHLPAEHLR
jgi:hypothetical protein